ncbi:unnamed protein product [Ceratitis capitata]|uniref:(Mediterranean fruit fly) hypothetical protein n=1 Tax=Ceratitis capitata TaxID=7213 RepID=A0A811UPQ2_CERCA|nr:unnamed protein product [Ceratitis capitata]
MSTRDEEILEWLRDIDSENSDIEGNDDESEKAAEIEEEDEIEETISEESEIVATDRTICKPFQAGQPQTRQSQETIINMIEKPKHTERPKGLAIIPQPLLLRSLKGCFLLKGIVSLLNI